MGKVVVSQFISLDGVVEDPGDTVALRLVDSKPAGETLILIYEPRASEAESA